MQLILNADTTVEIKTKMSINEENLDKCVSNILSAVENGNLLNGDITNGNQEAGDSNNDLMDIISKKVFDTNEESTALPNNVNQCEIPLEDLAELATSSKEHTDSCKIVKETELNDGTMDSTADPIENNVIVEERTDHVNKDIITNNDDIQNTIDPNALLTVENEHAEPTSIELDTSVKQFSADASECPAAETEHNGIDNMATVTDVNGVNSTANAGLTLTDNKEHAEDCIQTETEFTDLNTTVDTSAPKTNTVEEDCIKTSIKMKTDTNEISSTSNIDENTSKTCKKEKYACNSSTLNDDLVTCVNEIAASADPVEKIKFEKELCVEEKNKENENELIDSQKRNEPVNHIGTTENKSVSEVICGMEIKKNDMSEDITDAVNEHDNQDSENFLSLEKEINSAENKEKADGDKEISKEIDVMDIDETPETIEVKEKENKYLETSSVKSPSNLNGTSEQTVTVDCNVIEPVTVNKMETVEISDDIIFTLDDDDKDQTPNLNEKNVNETTEIMVDDDKTIIDCDNDTIKELDNIDKTVKEADKPFNEIIDLDETISKDMTTSSKDLIDEIKEQPENGTGKKTDEPKSVPPVLKLSNTLDILSDEEEEPKATNVDNKCINIEDDDEIMLIDDDTSGNERKPEPTKETESKQQTESKPQSPLENMEVSEEIERNTSEPVPTEETPVLEKENTETTLAPSISDKVEETNAGSDLKKTLLQENFLKTCKKSLADMTRDELEEFCILKIVESILDRSNLSEIRTKLKNVSQNIEEYKKKAMMLTKQNRDLQVVLKSIQEDQKKGTESIVPLKITRSVGMQVLMADKSMPRRKIIGLPPINKPKPRSPVSPSPRPQKPATPQIPVPRLVPANNPTLKSPNTQPINTAKITSPVPNGIRNVSPVQKGEKRSHNRIQSVTVDLTDDEPPAKVLNRAAGPAVPPVRLVPSQNLLAPPRPTTVNSPRKVYIPISGAQGQNVRPGQTIMLKTVPPQGPRQRCPPPHIVRMPQTMRLTRPQGMRHPAPLPDCVKQYQPPNWKALPPAPDLKLAKVENGIVISWKIEGYQEDSYEEIASYQLYAYQETSSPPSTALWKKIGDVKALPLPMACTLTQFMAGYKYYFAVRALDIRSRLGPFSLPGSILLLNKM